MKIYYIDTNSLLNYSITKNIYRDIAEDVDKKLDTLYFESDRLLAVGEEQKILDYWRIDFGEK